MTQPADSVLDQPLGHRFQIRQSPFVCVADMLCSIGSILIIYSVEPEIFWQHVKAELAYQFRDEQLVPLGGKFERTVLGRWFLILLGGIPKVLAIVSMATLPVSGGINLVSEKPLKAP